MTNPQKEQIKQLVIEQKELLGSFKAVSIKCDVSDALISQLVNNNWGKISDKAWIQIGAAIGWKRTGWQVVETLNTKMVCQVFEEAKNTGMWIAISNPAGSSKTESCNLYSSQNKTGVHLIECWEWSKKEFLKELCRNLGIQLPRGAFNANDLMKDIVSYFKERVNIKPLLIIDEADKLRPGALRNLIPLYNKLNGQMGLVILGTENLKKEIKRGVGYSVKGYDEIDSRFGRAYINLIGATKKEVIKIAAANGLEDRTVSIAIFNECVPVQKVVNGRTIMVVQDLRRVKRAIQRELIRAAKRAVATAG